MEKRYIALRDYSFSRAALMRLDEKWIRQSIEKQEKALKELKVINELFIFLLLFVLLY